MSRTSVLYHQTAIQVEKTLFRIHSYFFIRDSVKFNKLLQPSATAGHLREGSQSNPIVVPDILPEDFATFLWVFYNPCVVIVPFADFVLFWP